MMIATTRNVTLPHEQGSQSVAVINGIVIVGANGSGKTRLGVWLEKDSPEQRLVLRVSAQKSLAFPENIRPMESDKARNLFFGGHENAQPEQYVPEKIRSRYGNKPATTIQNDFDVLLVHLFSEQNDVSNKYREDSKLTDIKLVVPSTKLDKIKTIWEEILSHRTLMISGGTITVQPNAYNPKYYKASEMSDGERVIFYLIGQCLSAQENGIIVIDEPELHLHKSIQYTLWNKIERERSDCLFVYLTHDIDFAVSRSGFKKINLENFNGENWQWSSIQDSETVPENLALEIRGCKASSN